MSMQIGSRRRDVLALVGWIALTFTAAATGVFVSTGGRPAGLHGGSILKWPRHCRCMVASALLLGVPLLATAEIAKQSPPPCGHYDYEETAESMLKLVRVWDSGSSVANQAVMTLSNTFDQTAKFYRLAH